MQHLSIGAVSRLTQIPAHTLRKWESRHGIAVPQRTETGRRVYTQEQVEQLKLVSQLVSSGHSLANLAGLGVAALRELAGMHEAMPTRRKIGSLVLVGANVARLFQRSSLPSLATSRFTEGAQEWLARGSALPESAGLVIESDTLPQALVSKLIELRPRVASLIVVYAYANTRTVSALEAADIKPLQWPVSDEELLLFIEADRSLVAKAELRAQRFTVEELAQIAALNPGLECECPNHIAKLLMDISSFEKYSYECVDADPDERALHTHLAELSGRARELFEEALVAVAVADGIELPARDRA